jgi:steroid 5-alpha reductase family enzyme
MGVQALVERSDPALVMMSLKRFRGRSRSLGMQGEGSLVALDVVRDERTKAFLRELIASAWVFLSRFKTGKLVTQGTFAWCRNPIYASMILFIIPSLGVIYHSGLILSIAVVLYLGFKISIHGEVIVLKRTFGEEYEAYQKSVNEIFPFPPALKRKPENKNNL